MTRAPRLKRRVFYMCGVDWDWEPDVHLYQSLKALRIKHGDLSECGVTRVVLSEVQVLRRPKNRRAPARGRKK